ncbi:MAG TPA: hypothetical protein PLA90_13725 [Candidatus Sumerlaeota bacterium]|nr:hypothetical protein [Candidatus Sumerlaeota bacterium]
MGKILFILLLIGMSSALSAVAPIVTSPKDGDIWRLGTTQTITWLANGCTGNVLIEFFQVDGNCCGELNQVYIPVQAQKYVWQVGKTANGEPMVAGGTYVLHVIGLDDSAFGRSGKFIVGLGLSSVNVSVNVRRVHEIEYRWPPQSDPCLCPEFDLRQLADALGPSSFVGSLWLLKNGQKLQQLGTIAQGSRLPGLLKAKLSRGDYDQMKGGKARFTLAMLGAGGEILSQHDLRNRP